MRRRASRKGLSEFIAETIRFSSPSTHAMATKSYATVLISVTKCHTTIAAHITVATLFSYSLSLSTAQG